MNEAVAALFANKKQRKRSILTNKEVSNATFYRHKKRKLQENQEDEIIIEDDQEKEDNETVMCDGNCII
jgi:hypothetical protein